MSEEVKPPSDTEVVKDSKKIESKKSKTKKNKIKIFNQD